MLENKLNEKFNQFLCLEHLNISLSNTMKNKNVCKNTHLEMNGESL
jgi:hypothetical protein